MRIKKLQLPFGQQAPSEAGKASARGSLSITCPQATHAHTGDQMCTQGKPALWSLHTQSASNCHLACQAPDHAGLCWDYWFVIGYYFCSTVILVRELVTMVSISNWCEFYRVS